MHAHSEISPPRYLLDIVENMVNRKAVGWTVPDCGLSAALRYSMRFEDGSRIFVKAATDDETAKWLRTEHLVLSAMQKNFMPFIIGWVDTPGVFPMLATQDLSHAYWPADHSGVTWREGDFELLFSGIKEIAALPAPPDLPELHKGKTSIWSKIAGNPEAFLKLKLCSEAWIGKAAGALAEAETGLDVRGGCLVHGDIRSDNVCFEGSKVLFVDWSHASRGYGRHDLAVVLPTLHLEGAPSPYLMMPDAGGEAAMGCAMHIHRLATDRHMPQWLKRVFKQLIAIELEWAARCLDLDEPDGTRWHDI